MLFDIVPAMSELERKKYAANVVSSRLAEQFTQGSEYLFLPWVDEEGVFPDESAYYPLLPGLLEYAHLLRSIFSTTDEDGMLPTTREVAQALLPDDYNQSPDVAISAIQKAVPFVFTPEEYAYIKELKMKQLAFRLRENDPTLYSRNGAEGGLEKTRKYSKAELVEHSGKIPWTDEEIVYLIMLYGTDRVPNSNSLSTGRYSIQEIVDILNSDIHGKPVRTMYAVYAMLRDLRYGRPRGVTGSQYDFEL